MNRIPESSPWPFVLPFLAFMAVSILEPRFPETGPRPSERTGSGPAGQAAEQQAAEQQANDQYFADQRNRVVIRYCLVYGLKVALTCGLLCWFGRTWIPAFPMRGSAAALVVGIIGFGIWIGLTWPRLEHGLLEWTGLGGEKSRSQFNPFEMIDARGLLIAFLALRFFGLVIVVPLCEELFLRGFLMRWVESPQWWTVSLARMSFRGLLVAPLYGVITHPGEAIAAAVWFSLVTWQVNRSGNFWDAVLAHAVTNLLLGLYVCLFAQWQLW